MKWTFALLKHACQGEAFLCGIQLETQILEADAKDLSSIFHLEGRSPVKLPPSYNPPIPMTKPVSTKSQRRQGPLVHYLPIDILKEHRPIMMICYKCQVANPFNVETQKEVLPLSLLPKLCRASLGSRTWSSE